jgi:hypothetical protein
MGDPWGGLSTRCTAASVPLEELRMAPSSAGFVGQLCSELCEQQMLSAAPRRVSCPSHRISPFL